MNASTFENKKKKSKARELFVNFGEEIEYRGNNCSLYYVLKKLQTHFFFF